MRLFFIAITFISLLSWSPEAKAYLLGFGCKYTEEVLLAPEGLERVSLVLMTDAYVAVGKSKEYGCLKEEEAVERQLLAPGLIGNLTIGKRYFENDGQQVVSIQKGAAFKVTGVIAITKHGLSTIDSGPGPVFFLILRDAAGNTYKVLPYVLGKYEGPNGGDADLALAVAEDGHAPEGSRVKVLGYQSLPVSKAISYTGILEEMPNTLLQK